MAKKQENNKQLRDMYEEELARYEKKIEEAFEFKRRFTLVKVLSGKLVGKKISIYDLLKILLLFKEFQYSEKFLNLLIQKKIVWIDTIKIHLKKHARKFEKDLDLK